ncbi:MULTISPECIES: redoxin family protein [unclassified Fusibacter]|uniref:redoxin family protein n=1 Tax=unclassified Fusibacter TaxID=2624464 RepID=UPI00101377CD|nr:MULTISPECIES: redoxin family protein [unclassified Fusibacter]MCK8060048.1 redoxin family protein [Fusibacter sp. A2]NPE22190.1 redoxin family protein [Fusibacter sp. A1]RXV60966.1 hypothetical protein DWB64_10115 [Fusibacter sp. A1]
MKRLLGLTIILILIIQMPFASTDSPSTWAKDAIDEVFDKQLLDTRLQGNYQGEITRKDFAYIGVQIYEILTGEKTSVGNGTFTDTTDTYVLRAKNSGIVNGYPDGSYKPDAAIKRDELAVLFVNALNAAGIDVAVNDTTKFSDDSEIETWASASVYIARTYGIVNGVGENRFNPDGTATIEQAILMFKRVNDTFKKVDAGNEGQGGVVSDEYAPDFTLQTLSGETVTLSSLRGKPVVLNFFTSWCPPCLDEMPDIEKLHQENNGNIQFIGVNLTNQDNLSDVRDMIDTLSITFTVVKDEQGKVANDYGIRAIPTSVFIGSDGMVIHTQIGAISYETLKGYVDEMK